MRDFLGAEIAVGDRIVGVRHKQTSSRLFTGTVIKYAPKRIWYIEDGTTNERWISGRKVIVVNSIEDNLGGLV